MNSENYIILNGKRTELTDEQLKLLGIERPSNPFERVDKLELYYYISGRDDICCMWDGFATEDKLHFDNANYFNDEDFANRVMLHQQLYRKLLKYSYDNDAEVTEEDLKNNTSKYYICRSYEKFHVDCVAPAVTFGTVYFKSKEVAERAITDIIKPFMKEHPEIAW